VEYSIARILLSSKVKADSIAIQYTNEILRKNAIDQHMDEN
jgi:hypothetical protein